MGSDTDFLTGGEMSALIRDFDWASTPLGPVDTWPRSVLTTIGIILHSPVPIVTLWGEQGTMIYNDAYSRFAGGRHPSLLGSAVREGWPEVADFNDNVMKVGLGGGVLSYRDHELILRRRDGRPERVFMDLDYSPVIGEAGTPVGIIAIVVETTERVQADRKVRESEDRFRNIADAAPVMMWISDSARGCEWFNRPWLEFTGRPLEAELGEGWLDNLHPDDRDRVLTQYDRSFAGRTPFRIDFRLRRHDGAWRTLEETGAPQFSASGAFINFIGCCADVTEQRLSESALRESEERLRLSIEVGRMAVWEVDHATRAVAVSPELNLLLGLPADAHPTLTEIRALYAPGELERLARGGFTYESVVRSAAATAYGKGHSHLQVEFTIVTPAGEKKELLLRARHVPALQGRGLRTAGVLVDITERKRAEERLELVASEMRHRVKNALSIVQAIASQTIARECEDEGAAADFMSRLRALSTAMDLVLAEDSAPIPLTRLLDDMLRPYRDEDGASIRLAGPEVTLPARNATALCLVLHELCTNAIKYGALSSSAGRIDLTWRVEGGTLAMEWTERDGPPVEPPARRGFGSRLLASALGPGAVELTFGRQGLSVRLDVDLAP